MAYTETLNLSNKLWTTENNELMKEYEKNQPNKPSLSMIICYSNIYNEIVI